MASSGTHYETISDMADVSQLILVGTVIEVRDGRFIPAAEVVEDYAGTQWLEVVVEVERVLKGSAEVGNRIEVRWFGHDVRADGSRGPLMVVDGLMPPSLGENSLWFLVDQSSGLVSWGRSLTAVEGRLNIGTDGRLDLPTTVNSGAATELQGMTVDQVAELIGG